MRLRSRWLGLPLALLVLAPSGCDAIHPVSPGATPPGPTTATGVVKSLEFAFNQRDTDRIAGLLADDLQFETASGDSSGAIAPEPWNRLRLLAALRALLEGVPGHPPPAIRVQLTLDPQLKDMPDPRPGRSAEIHRIVRSQVSLSVTRADSTLLVATGALLFFVTRGDSAQIPADQLARGASPSARRWWIDQIGDETLPGGSAISAVSGPVWLGRILSFYEVTTAVLLHSSSADLRRRS